MSADTVWLTIGAMQTPISEALAAPDNRLLRPIFANPISSDLYYGVDNLAHSLMAGLADRAEAERHSAESAKDQLLHVAEAIGCRRWFPPGSEQVFKYAPGDDPAEDIEALLAAMSAKVGFEINFPNPFKGEMGVATSRGLGSYRAIHAIYQAHRILQELAGVSERTVLEIGPGMGRTAYYAARAGVRKYATIDLPIGVAAQACFLGATLGPDAIWMIGDPPAETRGRIRLLPSSGPLPPEHFSLVINVDSLPEMGAATMEVYGRWIAAHAGTFLSINQEAHATTVNAIGDRFFGTAAKTRAPYWLRPGYVEETFRFGVPQPRTSTP